MPTESDPTGNIQKAFDDYLAGLNLGLPIAFEGTDFTPTPGEPYLAATMAGRNQVVLTPGRHGPVEHDGIYQISVFYTRGVGVQKPLNDIVNAIASAFKIGTQFTVSPHFAQVT